MCPTITVGSFFSTRKVHFFVHLFNNLKPQQLQTSTTPTSEARPKRKEKTKQTSTTSITLFFRHYATFFEVFWIAPEGPPFICFDILQHNGCQKIAKGPPFYIFCHCDTSKISFKIFFWEIFSCLQRVPPSIFFKFFATSWSFTKPKGSPF